MVVQLQGVGRHRRTGIALPETFHCPLLEECLEWTQEEALDKTLDTIYDVLPPSIDKILVTYLDSYC